MTDVATILAQLNTVQVAACTAWGEGRGGSPELRVAELSTVANRLKAGRPDWGLTIAAVCLRRGAYSCWSPLDGEANYFAVIAEAKKLIAEPQVVGAIGPIMRECLALATRLVGGTLQDSVSDSTHYYAPAAMKPLGRVPPWAVGLSPAATVDGTLFFAGVK
jgi:hypothetical protein